MNAFDTRPSPRLVYGAGRLDELPEVVASVGGRKVLLVTDRGILAAGHVERAVKLLESGGFEVATYADSHINPAESDIEACRVFAAEVSPDLIIGFGGGSSMDTAKGCNFLLHNGGRMADYRGYGLAKNALLPFIAVPTTAGTGSECQSYAVVSRDGSHEKMACGDPKALARVALLDPELTVSQPAAVATLTALDALSHALESAVCTRRNPVSLAYSRESFGLIASAIEAVLDGSADLEARGRMLLGAAMAGSAIENSMLGAAHAAANPLTARFGIAHGHAVSLTLPHVVRFNAGLPEVAAVYRDLGGFLKKPLIDWLDDVLELADLGDAGIDAEMIPQLAMDASKQWTGQFNPRTFEPGDFEQLYDRLSKKEVGA